MILLVAFIVISGCKSYDEHYISDDNDEVKIDVINESEYIYVPEIITSPEFMGNLEYIRNITFYENKVYFIASGANDMFSESIYSMEMTGNDISHLSDYSKPSSLINEGGSVYINNLISDGFGNLWVVETVFPENDTNETILIRKLNSAGSELMVLDISDYVTDIILSNFQFTIDNDNNIYVGFENRIYVFDISGELLFFLTTGDRVSRIIKLQTGTAVYNIGQRALRIIDFENKTCGETINLPMNVQNIFPGNVKFHCLYTRGSLLYGIDIITNKEELILDFLDSDLLFDSILNINLMENGQIVLVMFTSHGLLDAPTTEIVIMTKLPVSERKNKEFLTLAGINIDFNIRNAIVLFNRNSTTHRINLIDYSNFNIGINDNTGLMRLTTEIIAGKIPDILALSGLPFQKYTKQGLFVDLNEFLDNDPELNREDLFNNLLLISQVDEALYRLFPAFSISTVIGNPEKIGFETGWTIDEFITLLDANPDADIPFGEQMSKILFLNLVLMHNIDQFVDRTLGKAYFNNDNFIGMLETANRFPAEAVNAGFAAIGEGEEHIAAGRQIMVWMQLRDFLIFRMNRTIYGGEVVFKGFPGESGTGNALNIYGDVAISSQSEYQNEAWEFIKFLLSEDFAKNHIPVLFPINRNAFNKRLHSATDKENQFGINLHSGMFLNVPELRDDEAEQIYNLINSISIVIDSDETIWNIISENAGDYFNGQTTAQDAARIIQNRVQIYLNEMQ